MQLSKGFWQRELRPRQYLAAVVLFAGMLFLLRYEHFIHLEEPARLPPGTYDFLITPAGSGVETPPGLNATDAFSIDGVDYTLDRSAKTSRTPRPGEP